jgi:hypothetical protein
MLEYIVWVICNLTILTQYIHTNPKESSSLQLTLIVNLFSQGGKGQGGPGLPNSPQLLPWAQACLPVYPFRLCPGNILLTHAESFLWISSSSADHSG